MLICIQFQHLKTTELTRQTKKLIRIHLAAKERVFEWVLNLDKKASKEQRIYVYK